MRLLLHGFSGRDSVKRTVSIIYRMLSTFGSRHTHMQVPVNALILLPTDQVIVTQVDVLVAELREASQRLLLRRLTLTTIHSSRYRYIYLTVMNLSLLLKA